MIGRNGMDDLASFEVKVSWIPLILCLFTSRYQYVASACNVIFWAIIIHAYYRVFSRNLRKRYEENQKFLNFRYNMTVKRNKAKRRNQQKKEYCFFKCPMCRQEVRVPKGHGRIEITCPKCREKFVKRS